MNNILIDQQRLQRLQQQFSSANDVYLSCINRKREVLENFNWEGEVEEYFKKIITTDVINRILTNVERSQVETIVEEPLEFPFVKLRAIISKIEGNVQLIWLVVAVIQEDVPEDIVLPEGIYRISEDRFPKSLALLETLSNHILSVKEGAVDALTSLKKVMETELALKEQVYRSGAMVSVIHMLEEKEGFSQLAYKAIQEMCQVLDVQGGCILREHVDGVHVEVISEYSSANSWSVGNKIQTILKEDIPFFDGKPYMISSTSMVPERIASFFKRLHLTTGVFQPMEINGKPTMYLCLYDFNQERDWSLEDVKFINGIKGVIQSILVRKITQNSLVSSYSSLEAILEHIGCAVYVVDCNAKEILYINNKLKEVFACEEQTTLLQKYLIDENLGLEFKSHEIFISDFDKWVDANQTQISWVDGRTVYLGTLYDITERKHYQENIEKQVDTDYLTGLYNRKRCIEDLGAYIKEAERAKCEGAYLQIDLDDFKNINDGLGYQYGDALLKAIAHNFQRIQGVGNHCYRTGGDEFTILLYGEAYEELERICDEVKNIFERPWYLKGADYFCTMSMGVARFPTDANTVNDLTRKVDMALLTAKKRGKNCIEYYNEKVEDTSFYRLDLEKNMRKATLDACHEFEVYYQPIVDVEKPGAPCCGAEALVRWNSAKLGFISPNDFIPLAEYLGLINPIGEYVLYEAVRRCKYWNDCGHPEYKVNVNLSVIQLLQNDIVDKIQRVLEETKINPKNVTLEVTESLAIADMKRIQLILKKIKELGVRVALDDFGTGYSSLNHIREMPIDIIKIDRCFVENLSDDDFSGAFVKMVSELAKTIGVMVCVEGVEEAKQLQALTNMNVRLIQGYYYGKPMKIQDFEEMYL